MATVKGGAKLQKALEALNDKLKGKRTLRVGFLEGTTEPNGASTPMVAFVNEYGRPDKGQPPRPFFRNMVSDNEKSWGPAAAGLMKQHNYDADKVLDDMGKLMRDQLKLSINQLTSPPLAASTIARKGFDKPLIDTASMRDHVDYEVKKS